MRGKSLQEQGRVLGIAFCLAGLLLAVPRHGWAQG
jgi:hypothetical protein